MFAGEDIPSGHFVCEYVGEFISNSEADRRLQEYDRINCIQQQSELNEHHGPGTYRFWGGHALLVSASVKYSYANVARMQHVIRFPECTWN